MSSSFKTETKPREYRSLRPLPCVGYYTTSSIRVSSAPPSMSSRENIATSSSLIDGGNNITSYAIKDTKDRESKSIISTDTQVVSSFFLGPGYL